MEQATSHDEFADKYTKTGSIGQMLIARFFDGIQAMVNESGVTSGKALEVGAGQGFSTAKLNSSRNRWLRQRHETRGST